MGVAGCKGEGSTQPTWPSAVENGNDGRVVSSAARAASVISLSISPRLFQSSVSLSLCVSFRPLCHCLYVSFRHLSPCLSAPLSVISLPVSHLFQISLSIPPIYSFSPSLTLHFSLNIFISFHLSLSPFFSFSRSISSIIFIFLSTLVIFISFFLIIISSSLSPSL